MSTEMGLIAELSAGFVDIAMGSAKSSFLEIDCTDDWSLMASQCI